MLTRKPESHSGVFAVARTVSGEPLHRSFVCPKCRSSYFSTDLSGDISDDKNDKSKWIGRCKGVVEWIVIGKMRYRDYKGCDFSWTRDKDELYFTGCD